MKLVIRASLFFALFAGTAFAGDKLVVQITPSRIIRVDGTTGAIVNNNFVDIDALLGYGGAFKETRDIVMPPNGEIWVSNRTDQLVLRFDGTGTTYLGSFPTGACLGMEIANGSLWIAEAAGGFGAALVQYDLATQMLTGGVSLVSPRDVYSFNNQLLVSQFDGTIASIDPATTMFTGTFSSPGATLYQMIELASGNLLVARWGPPGLFVIDPTGVLLSTLPVSFGQPEGVSELGNGHYLVSTQQGIYSYDPATQTGALINSHPALFVYEMPIHFTGQPFCFGDGSGTACPCGNSGSSGNGCASSVNAAGAHLSAIGTPSLAADTVVLSGANMPNSSALYFQGTTQVAGGAGTVFGDGLRCAGGSIVRLRTLTNAAGASSYPGVGDPLLSVRGMVTMPGVRTYQVWYRNAAAFCTSSTFNLSNGLEITWGP
jgi:hypothetical protein